MEHTDLLTIAVVVAVVGGGWSAISDVVAETNDRFDAAALTEPTVRSVGYSSWDDCALLQDVDAVVVR